MAEISDSEKFKKVLYVLVEHYSRTHPFISEVLNACSFRLQSIDYGRVYFTQTDYNLIIYLPHKIFSKNSHRLNNIKSLLYRDIEIFSTFQVKDISIEIDYDKFEIVESKIKPIQTDWEEINEGQKKLFEQLSLSSDSLDLQHIGNISRTIMLKLSDTLYVDEKHNPESKNILVTPDKFKNRLHSYIKKELAGEQNKELRSLAEASIASVEKTIDLANTITHKTDVDRTFAEVCVIGTISAISIIKLIHKRSTT
jgi:hypothetical protein